MQSHKAITKFNLANVSLCVRSSNVSTGRSGALNVQGTFHMPVAHWKAWSAKASLAKCRDISPATTSKKKEREKYNQTKCNDAHNYAWLNAWRCMLPCCSSCVDEESLIGGDCCVVGLICHRYGAIGGDSDNEPPETDRRLPTGGEPIANWTAGGDIELILMADGAVAAALFTLFGSLLLRWSDRFILIGWERGIAFVVLFCGNDAGFIARRTLDGNGTGFGSEIFKVLGLDCVSAVVHVGETLFALSGDCCTRVFWLRKRKMF